MWVWGSVVDFIVRISVITQGATPRLMCVSPVIVAVHMIMVDEGAWVCCFQVLLVKMPMRVLYHLLSFSFLLAQSSHHIGRQPL